MFGSDSVCLEGEQETRKRPIKNKTTRHIQKTRIYVTTISLLWKPNTDPFMARGQQGRRDEKHDQVIHRLLVFEQS